jgi:ATP-dependent DNA helicase PIF1
MANRAVLACVEETCRHVMCNNHTPFGGKIVILLGDFRQTCPVIPGGSRRQIISASIKSSPLWNSFQIRRLITPVRNAEDVEFARYVDALGDGAGPDIPILMLAATTTEEDILSFTFPPPILSNPVACSRRAILAPTNRQVNQYNSLIIHRLQGQSRTYLSSDSIREADESGLVDILPSSLMDDLKTKHIHGLPPHRLFLKTNATCRILRNLSISRGLVKNSRVVIADIGSRIVTVRLIRENTAGRTIIDPEDILIPRISFLHTLSSAHTLVRRQFPIDLAYSTTFNSCQGLTLDKVAVDLTTPVFSHGQLYTALSRIRKREDGIVCVNPGPLTTKNITYHEILT